MMTTLGKFEELLRSAGMKDLAEKVCVWDVDRIFSEAYSRPGFTDTLMAWHIAWSVEHRNE